MLDQTAFLGVARSATGRRWVGPDAAVERRAEAIAQQTDAPLTLARVLARRGVGPEDAAAYLAPTMAALMPDPSTLRDMDAAAERLVRAALDRERVAVFGDYDVDGAASSAVIARWLRGQGVEPTLYVPDRIDEGYGPNAPAMETLADAHDLIVCVDCGTLSHGPLDAARRRGADVVVVDHHLCGETLPPAVAVVNPNRADDRSDCGGLCAAGVAFMLVVAANRALRGLGRPVEDPRQWLDMVALATVADVAPLKGLNRALVRQGLKALAMRRNPGLRALADAARISGPPASFHLSYVLGPRINAGGRVGAADLGARLLSTDDDATAAGLAAKLCDLNEERRRVEAGVLHAALSQAEARGVERPLVWAYGPGWHPGVVGIVASRLKERFSRPVVVLGGADGEAKGSGRSIHGVDLGGAVARLAREGLIAKGGGHRMAAGLSLPAAGVKAAMARLEALMADAGADAAGPQDLAVDGAVAPAAADLALAEALEAAGPWGAAAPAPIFAAPACRVLDAGVVGERHVRLRLDDGRARLDGVAFGAVGGPLGDFLLGARGASAHVAGRLTIDDWRGRRRVTLQVDDAAPA